MSSRACGSIPGAGDGVSGRTALCSPSFKATGRRSASADRLRLSQLRVGRAAGGVKVDGFAVPARPRAHAADRGRNHSARPAARRSVPYVSVPVCPSPATMAAPQPSGPREQQPPPGQRSAVATAARAAASSGMSAKARLNRQQERCQRARRGPQPAQCRQSTSATTARCGPSPSRAAASAAPRTQLRPCGAARAHPWPPPVPSRRASRLASVGHRPRLRPRPRAAAAAAAAAARAAFATGAGSPVVPPRDLQRPGLEQGGAAATCHRRVLSDRGTATPARRGSGRPPTVAVAGALCLRATARWASW